MSVQVGCLISLRHDEGRTYPVKLHHYESLKDALDRRETGWVELESVHADGRLLCRLEDIADLFLSTEAFAEDREAFLAHEKLSE